MSWEEQERTWRQAPEAQQMTEWERQQFLAAAKTGRAVSGLGVVLKWLLVALAEDRAGRSVPRPSDKTAAQRVHSSGTYSVRCPASQRLTVGRDGSGSRR